MAQTVSNLLLLGAGSSGSASYTGPADILTGLTHAYGVQAYGSAGTTGSVKAINVRRVSDGTNKDIDILTTGLLDIATANTFAGTDASGTGAITGTTLTFTGGHVGDWVTGGTVAAGTIIISGSSPTWTVNISQTVASATLTLQYGLFVTTIYDQVGTYNATQSTTSDQPILVPNGGPNGGPAIWFNGSSMTLTASSGNAVATITWVGENTGSSLGPVFASFGGSSSGYDPTNKAYLDNGSLATATASDNAWHSIGGVYNGASSIINVDGTNTTVSPGGTVGSAATIGGNVSASQYFKGFLCEVFSWQSTQATSTQLNSLSVNMQSRYGL